MLKSYVVTFADGRRLSVDATCSDAARNAAYRVERELPIASIEPAQVG